MASNDDSNLDGYANSRYTIAVTAVHDRGSQSWYAEPGANILVAAPSDGRDGIYTTDPRVAPKAKKLNSISFEEMMEMSSQGAKVLQTRSKIFTQVLKSQKKII